MFLEGWGGGGVPHLKQSALFSSLHWTVHSDHMGDVKRCHNHMMFSRVQCFTPRWSYWMGGERQMPAFLHVHCLEFKNKISILIRWWGWMIVLKFRLLIYIKCLNAPSFAHGQNAVIQNQNVYKLSIYMAYECHELLLHLCIYDLRPFLQMVILSYADTTISTF